jgi:hypothetical protein
MTITSQIIIISFNNVHPCRVTSRHEQEKMEKRIKDITSTDTLDMKCPPDKTGGRG